MGSTEGPKLFTEEEYGEDAFLLARISAQMSDVQLGNPPNQCRATEFFRGSLRKREDVPTLMGAEEALRRMEEGL